MRRRIAICALMVAVCVASARDRIVPLSRTERLARLAELDGAVRYFHPDVARGAIHWDSLLASRAIGIGNAKTSGEYGLRISELVRRLGDPVTRVVNAPRTWAASLVEGVLVIRPGVSTQMSQIAELALAAHAVVVDLRKGADSPPDALIAIASNAGTMQAPPSLGIRYDGFPPTSGTSSGGFHITSRVIPGEEFKGSKVSAQKAQRFAFLVDSQSVLPPVAQALRSEERAKFIATTPLDKVTVAAPIYAIPMGEGVVVNIRIAERVATATNCVAVDTTILGDSSLIAKAAQYAAAGSVRRYSRADNDTVRRAVAVLPSPVYREWKSMMPSAGFRLLAVFRLWNTMHYFSPYKAIMGNDWNAALRSAIPRAETAGDSIEFVKAVASFAAKLNDSHVTITSIPFQIAVGAAPAGIKVRFVEKQLVVVKLPIDSIALRTGLKIGDVIISVDGETVASRSRRLATLFAASTDQSMRSRIARFILNGADRSFATLTVRDAAGTNRNVDVPRAFMFRPLVEEKARTGASLIRVLPGNIGYVDLDRLPRDLTDSAFTVLQNTRAIIFDMRGYPNGIFSTIGPRLNRRDDSTSAASIRRLVVNSPDTNETFVYHFFQPIPPRGSAVRYTGRTVMLIDETSMSQAEHTGMFFEAANGTTMIGSPSAGANGDLTNFPLPGGISVAFSGHDIRHADDRQLQRVGLVPDVLITPTIAGIRAGRDEVLQTAFRYLGGIGEVPVEPAGDRLRQK